MAGEPQSRASADLVRGRQFGAQGKWKEAEAELRAYELAHPDSAEALAVHSEALIQLGQPFDAALEVQEFLQRHPEALRAHELYAVLAAGPLKDGALTVSELETCVQIAPADFQAWKSLGDAYLDQAKPKEAVRAYGAAFRLRPRDAVAAASLAYANAENGDDRMAAQQFRIAEQLVRLPDQPRKSAAVVEYLRGVYLAKQGLAPESVDALTKAIAFNQRSSEAYYQRAKAYQRAGQADRAQSDALKAIELSPSNKEAALLLITLYRKAGDMGAAQRYADLAQKITDEEQAQQTFGRGLRDTLDKAEPLLREGRFAEAIPLYESIVQKLPTFYEAYFDLGNCYAQTGRPADAEAAFKKYLSYQPVSADGHASLGILLLQQGNKAAAIPELRQALDIDPTLLEVRKALANEHMQAGDFSAAVEVLRPANDSHDAQAETMLAEALDKTGDRSSALTAVNRALATDPADAQALQLREELLGSGAAAEKR